MSENIIYNLENRKAEKVMKVLKYLLLLIMMMSLVNTGNAAEQDENAHQEALNDRDWEVLRDYLKERREEKKQDNPCSLVLSGDVRTEWRHMTETLNGEDIRGGGKQLNKRCFPISKNDFDIEFNLRFDYTCDRAWAVAAVEFDNSAGVDDNEHPCDFDEGGQVCRKFGKRANTIKRDPCGFKGSGACDDVCLKKAYFGYTVWECGEAFIDVELGRRNLYSCFDSRVQFLSRFDGLLVRYENAIEDCATFYWQAAGFLIDERVNHFGWVTELGLLDIADTRLDLKYSIIDWRKRGHSRCNVRNPNAFRFVTSQWTMGYNFDKDVFKRRAKIFAAYLYNHGSGRAAVGENCLDGDLPNNCCRDHGGKRDPRAWYLGFSLGEVVKEGDWLIEVQYQWVGATAMPDEDAGGIGTGNVQNKIITADGYGYTNFRGWKFEALYALTDNLSVDTILEFSKQIKKSIGCVKRTYSKFEVEFIYAF